MATQGEANLYDAYYFKHGCGRPYERTAEWLQFFDAIADKIVREIGPRTVLDAGCAMGFLVEGLRNRGIEAFGMDISEYALQQVHPDFRSYCWLGSVTDPLPQKYDLIVCIEVLEHLTSRDAEHAIENFCQHCDDILFSSTPWDYKEITHCNVQPPEYWAKLFARYGFFRDVDFDASFITPWAVRFRKRREPVSRVIAGYERRYWQLKQENDALRNACIELRDQVAADEKTIAALNAQLAEITNSRGWRWLTFWRRVRLALVPKNSWRERLIFGDNRK